MSDAQFFTDMLNKKYAQRQQEVNAQAAQNYAQANLQNQQAGMVRPLGEAEIGQRNASAYLDRERGGVVKPLADSEINRNNAFANYTNAQTDMYRPFINSQIDQNNASAFQMRSEGLAIPFRAIDDIMRNRYTAYPTNTDGDRQGRANYLSDIESLRRTMGYQRGTAMVPGKGSGDKVPAMLEPGEAVLNKKAAGMIGRGKIAAANKAGNASRDRQDSSKIAALLMKMARGMA